MGRKGAHTPACASHAVHPRCLVGGSIGGHRAASTCIFAVCRLDPVQVEEAEGDNQRARPGGDAQSAEQRSRVTVLNRSAPPPSTRLPHWRLRPLQLHSLPSLDRHRLRKGIEARHGGAGEVNE